MIITLKVKGCHKVAHGTKTLHKIPKLFTTQTGAMKSTSEFMASPSQVITIKTFTFETTPLWLGVLLGIMWCIVISPTAIVMDRGTAGYVFCRCSLTAPYKHSDVNPHTTKLPYTIMDGWCASKMFHPLAITRHFEPAS